MQWIRNSTRRILHYKSTKSLLLLQYYHYLSFFEIISSLFVKTSFILHNTNRRFMIHRKVRVLKNFKVIVVIYNLFLIILSIETIRYIELLINCQHYESALKVSILYIIYYIVNQLNQKKKQKRKICLSFHKNIVLIWMIVNII